MQHKGVFGRGDKVCDSDPVARGARRIMVPRMPARTRKLIGTVVLLLFLAAYVALVAAIGVGRIADSGPLTALGYALVAGLVWVLPAGCLIRWMQRP
jgi:hypothetical protein